MKRIRLVILSLLSLPVLLWADDGRIEIAQEDLPLTIAAPDSYILTGNLSGAGIGDAIIISSDQVHLDLNGFQMIGTGGSGDAVSIGSFKNVTIRNGTIRDWAANGINAASASKSVFEDLILSDNGLTGITAGNHCRIVNVTSESNQNHGIAAGNGSLIRHCVASENGNGLLPSDSGILVGDSCIILECLTYNNKDNEIKAGSGNRIERNLCDCNGTADSPATLHTGIQILLNDNLVRDNHVTGCATGYKIEASDNIVVANTAANNDSDFNISAGNTAGEETDDIASTNNVNAGHGFMNIRQ